LKRRNERTAQRQELPRQEFPRHELPRQEFPRHELPRAVDRLESGVLFMDSPFSPLTAEPW
jgi:hypothetical protein